MKHPQEHTRRTICKLLRGASFGVDHEPTYLSVQIDWVSPAAERGAIVVLPDGTAEGTFPPELFAALCPDP
jgi:hypothetical protein